MQIRKYQDTNNYESKNQSRTRRRSIQDWRNRLDEIGMINILLLFIFIFLSGCTSTSKNVDLREIRKTNDELYDLWWRGERWGKEFEEL